MKVMGQIIRILDNRTVIVNKGREDGITDNTVFRILGEPEQIIDPASGESLGAVTVVKSRVKAQKVNDKFTIAHTSWTESKVDWSSVLGTGSLAALAYPRSAWLLGGIGKTEMVDEGELRVNPDQVKPWKAQSESPVSIGDVVEAEVPTPVARTEPEQIPVNAEEDTAAVP